MEAVVSHRPDQPFPQVCIFFEDDDSTGTVVISFRTLQVAEAIAAALRNGATGVVIL